MRNIIPLSIPNFEGNERKYVDDAVSQGWVSTGGAYINQFEKQMSKYLNVHSVAACQSGTSAIHLSLVEAGVMPGDMVVVPTLTFIAAVNPVRYQFAEPIFMDCDESLCIDPIKLLEFCKNECEFKENKLIYKANGKHIKAIVVVHVFGNMADMERIMKIADDYNLFVIEDSTEALGTMYTEGKYTGRYAGTIGHFGAYSFNGNKIITTGGGGAVTANSKEKVDHIRYISTQAKNDSNYYIHDEIGYNYRMTNVQAALGVAQLEELSEFVLRKQKNYDLYSDLFKNFELGKLIGFRDGTSSNKWFYSLEIDQSRVRATMKEIIVALEAKGIQTRAIWGLIHEQKPYKDFIAYKIEKASHYCNCVLNLPSSTQITREEIKYVTEQIKTVLAKFVSE